MDSNPWGYRSCHVAYTCHVIQPETEDPALYDDFFRDTFGLVSGGGYRRKCQTCNVTFKGRMNQIFLWKLVDSSVINSYRTNKPLYFVFRVPSQMRATQARGNSQISSRGVLHPRPFFLIFFEQSGLVDLKFDYSNL